jgi:hypothetical protein
MRTNDIGEESGESKSKGNEGHQQYQNVTASDHRLLLATATFNSCSKLN